MSDIERTITVSSFGLTREAQEALFDRIADAAHALDEQVTCFGSLRGVVECASLEFCLDPDGCGAPEVCFPCACGCPPAMHVGEIGCPCALPGEPPCDTSGVDR